MVVSNQQVAPIKMGESFIYLGKTFNFDMNLQESKSDLLSCIDSYLEKIINLPLHPSSKIEILNSYVYSKIHWSLSIYNFSMTWIKQNCDSIVSCQI